MKRVLIYGGVFGFALSCFWGIADFVVFSAAEGAFSRAFWNLKRVSVPLANLTPISFWWLAPFFNAAFYALAFGFIALITRSVKGNHTT